MRIITAIIGFLVVILGGGIASAEDLFGTVVTNLLSERPFNSPEIVTGLRELAKHHGTTRDERLSAQITLVLYLLDRDTTNMSKDELEEPFRICREIIQDSPDAWQAELAKFYLLFEPLNSGDRDRHLLLVQDALSVIDFERLEKVDNRLLKAAKRIYALGEETSWREVLLAVKALALCEKNRMSEADDILRSLTNDKHRQLVRARISLAKMMRKDAEDKRDEGTGPVKRPK